MEFFKTANKNDDFFLVGFNAQAELMSSFTDNPEYIQSGVLFAAPGANRVARRRLPRTHLHEELETYEAGLTHFFRWW